MNSLLDYFKKLDSITDSELKLTLSVLKQKSGAIREEDVAWYWQNQEHVYLGESDILSLEPIQYLNPETLVLCENRINSISNLVILERLKHLNLIGNNIKFIDGIESLTQLQELYLGDNLIIDISALSNMSNLKMLGLKNNSIKDIRSLLSLTGLVFLNLSGNPLDENQVNDLRGKLPGCKVMF